MQRLKSNLMNDYKITQKILHWLMGTIIILDLNVAQKFGNDMAMADRLESRGDHATLGSILLILLVLRVFIRLRSKTTDLPDSLSEGDAHLAKLAHRTIYICMFVLIATGLLTAGQASDPILVFGSLDLVFLSNLDKEQFLFVRQFHNAMTWAMIFLIGIHVLAAFYHHLILKDDSLRRMLRFWKRVR